MKTICCVIFVIVVLVLSSCAQPTAEPQVEKEAERQVVTPKKEWSEEESEEIAAHLLRSSSTFSSRGIEGSLRLLVTTPLEQSFSWQFDYEFKSWAPGYGRLTGEPTPRVITPHEARIVVQEGEVIYAVLDEEWDVLLGISSESSSQEESALRPSDDLPEGNLVRVYFIEEHHYNVSGDSFVNKEVTVEGWWRTNLLNFLDETGAPVIGLRLSLDSEMSFGGISGLLSGGVESDRLTTMGPPTYKWFLGDIPNGEVITANGWPWDAFVVRRRFPGKLVPGYDVSRSFDKTVFSAPGVQTLTITLTPREESIDTVTIFVHTEKDDFVDPVILSYSSTSGGDINIASGGHRSGISLVPVEINIPMTVTVTIQVTPKVPLVHYKPGTTIQTNRVSVPDSGITTGNSVSFTTEVGTWTWSAEGDYVWDWVFNPTSDVSVSFARGSSFAISILILGVVTLGAIILGIILHRRRRKRVSA